MSGLADDIKGGVFLRDENAVTYGVAQTNNAIHVINFGSAGSELAQDSSTGAIIVLEHDQQEIHDGKSYVISDVQNINSTTVKWQIITPDSIVEQHMEFDIECTGEMYMVITEGSDRLAGTPITPVNRNRRSANTSTLTASRTPTGGTTDGAVIKQYRTGSTGVGSRTISGGGARGTNEWILKRNTKYIIAVTTYADVYVTIGIDFFEHTSL